MNQRCLAAALGMVLLIQSACLQPTGRCWKDEHCTPGSCNLQTHLCTGQPGDGGSSADMQSACTWPTQAQLLDITFPPAISPTPGAMLGSALAAVPGVVFVGVPRYKQATLTTGGVYVIPVSSGAMPTAQALLLPPMPMGNEYLGAALAASADTLLVGPDLSQNSKEAVYLFKNSAGSWQAAQTLTAPGGVIMKFGNALAYDGGTLAYLGAPAKYDQATGNKLVGAVYAVDVTTGMLTGGPQEGTQDGGGFGKQLALSQTDLVVAAPSENAGVVYGVARAAFPNSSATPITPSAGTGAAYLGSAMAVIGTTLVVGPGRLSMDSRVYYFKWSDSDSNFILQSTISPAAMSAPSFGSVLALLSQDLVAIGEPDLPSGAATGAVHLYDLTQPDPTEADPKVGRRLLATIPAPAAAAGFGGALAASGNTLYIGASATASGNGAVYRISCL